MKLIVYSIDGAAPGSTIQLGSGVYSGGVAVHTDRITIRGTGPGTILEPGTVDHCAPQGAGPGCGLDLRAKPPSLVSDASERDNAPWSGFSAAEMIRPMLAPLARRPERVGTAARASPAIREGSGFKLRIGSRQERR